MSSRPRSAGSSTSCGRVHEFRPSTPACGIPVPQRLDVPVRNGNLLFHGCVPLNEDGTFASMNCEGTWRSGRDYLDFCDEIARRAWRDRDRSALDWLWYLWIGFRSPASGRYVKTFERSYIEDKSTWKSPWTRTSRSRTSRAPATR